MGIIGPRFRVRAVLKMRDSRLGVWDKFVALLGANEVDLSPALATRPLELSLSLPAGDRGVDAGRGHC